MPDLHSTSAGGHAPHGIAGDRTVRNAIVGDHQAALEAEAGIERLLRDIRDLERDERAHPQRMQRLRLAVGRALVALGNGLAESAGADDPCPDATGMA